MKIQLSLLSVLIILLSCSPKDDNNSTPPVNTETMYYPSGTAWETKSISDLKWNQSAVQPLLDYLNSTNAKSFMILVDGKIVMENYFNGHNATSSWYWASAGKTLTATVTGIAQQEGLLNINNKVSDYIGKGWTSETLIQENLITCKNLLTMTSGINDYVNGAYSDDVTPASLNYIANAGTRWAYHNVYVKLQDVITAVSKQAYEDYFKAKLKDKIGMDGSWFILDNNKIYFSTTRSMARFGLLMLNKGKWENTQILNEAYFTEATNTSQNINVSYGYLWWLNGKASYHLPQVQTEYPGSIIPSGPSDMFMALGKNDQKIYVVPSKKMVVIRMGDAADKLNLALSPFDNDLWKKINALYQ